MEVCDQHEFIRGTLEKISNTQELQAAALNEIATSMAVTQAILKDMRKTKALNCEQRIVDLEGDSKSFRKLRVGPRITELEGNSSNCQELRVGPRLEKVEARQDKMFMSGIFVIVLTIIGGVIKALWK